MKNKQGFTLIELLVVVLIIGILAAVAVPQYQKAVDKSRLMQLITAVKSVKQAEETYYLANGEYTADWDALMLDFAGTISGATLTNDSGLSLTLVNMTTAPEIRARSSKLTDIMIWQALDHGSVSPRELYCEPLTTQASKHQLCKSISSTPNGYSCGSSDTCYTLSF